MHQKMTFGGLSPGMSPVYRFRSWWWWWCPLTLALTRAPVRKVGYRAKPRGFLHRCGVLVGDVVGEVVIALHQIEKAALCLKSCDETVTALPETTVRRRGETRKDGVLVI
jgi:hypothetical protein